MPGRLEGKVAIVTGAGSRAVGGEVLAAAEQAGIRATSRGGIGNGRAAAIIFAKEGARVLLVDRVIEAARATESMIAEDGGECAVYEADVTKPGDCRGMVGDAVARWGKLDILQNNVGIGSAGRVPDVALEDWERVLRINVTGMMLAAQAAIPVMAKGGGGAMVNVSSIASQRPRGLTPYATSKGAVEALTRGLAADHARDGIRVNCIAPGPVYTPMVYAGGMSPELREARRKASPLGIEGSAWDIAYASLYLASDEARYVTGVVLPVDGGVLLTSR
jgi:NAD(P)-dependent dehydrogenase (short-subunit alcohol dehydrogenase family)